MSDGDGDGGSRDLERRRRRREDARRRVHARRRLTGASIVFLALVVIGVLLLTGSSTAPRKTARALAPATPLARLPGRATDSTAADAATVARVLRRTPYLAGGTPRRKEIALTFDDGPGTATPALLRFLERRRVKATFFLVGRAVAEFPKLVARERRGGFVLGDHTQNHAFLSHFDAIGQAAEIDGASQAIQKAGGPTPRLFRPPYGAFDGSTLDLLRQRGMLMVLWAVDSEDFERPGVPRIVANVLTAARGGSVVLMHDGGGDRSQTLAALPAIVTHLRRRGYRLVTVPQLLRDDPPAGDQPAPVSLAGRN